MSDEERLQRYMARAGVASRRACERLIADGLVKVNNEVVTELGTKVRPGVDIVEFEGRQIVADVRSVYLLVNKPQHMISAVEDPEGRPVVTSLVPGDFGRLYPVGRLDWDSEGALLLTNDGELTNLLTHPRHEVEKTYLVKVTGLWADDDKRIDKLRDGVKLDDGYRTQPAHVTRDSDTGKHTWFVVSIREGKNRQIRRMFEAVHIDVRRLRRIAYGPVLMGDLQPGDWRRLSEGEIDELYEAAGAERPVTSASRGRLAHDKREGKLEARRAAKRHLRKARPASSSPPAREERPPDQSDHGGKPRGGSKGRTSGGGGSKGRTSGGGGAPKGRASGGGGAPKGRTSGGGGAPKGRTSGGGGAPKGRGAPSKGGGPGGRSGGPKGRGGGGRGGR